MNFHIKQCISLGLGRHPSGGGCHLAGGPHDLRRVINGVDAGALAGNVASEAFSSGDVSRSGLETYEDLWRRWECRRVGWNKRVRTIYNSLNDRELNQEILTLQSEDTGSLDMKCAIRSVFQHHSRLLLRMIWGRDHRNAFKSLGSQALYGWSWQVYPSNSSDCFHTGIDISIFGKPIRLSWGLRLPHRPGGGECGGTQ